MIIRIENVLSNPNNFVKFSSPHWVNLNGMVMISSAVRQDVGIVYNLNRKFLSLGPSHFVPWLGRVVLSVERELTVLGNDITNRRRPPGRLNAIDDHLGHH